MTGRLVHRITTAMSSVPAAFVLFLLVSVPFPHSASGQGCLYQYLRQPPSSLEPLCNPYAPVATLRVQCQAAVPSSEAAAVEILWFYNNQRITGSFPAVIEVSPLEEAMGRSMITSTLAFDGDNFNDTFQGNYSCQIVVDGNNSTAPSNSLLLEAEDLYIIFTNTPCRTDYFSENITCVGNRSLLLLPATTVGGETSPDAGASTSNTVVANTGTSTALPESSPPLQVWVYVLVAIAAVFGMIIVVLTILCVGLCLKKNKTEDTYRQKGVEIQQFTSNSMVSNGLYQRKDEGGVTSGTHISSHSQISDYNTLNHERDYEVIDMGEDKHDYHHLQRPSPPTLPGGRNFSFTPPTEFQSMSTLMSQIGNNAVASSDAFQHGKMSKTGFLTASPSEGPPEHVYRELEQTLPGAGIRLEPIKDIYRSPTDSESPDSARLFNKGALPSIPGDSGVFNESLYTPNLESSLPSRIQQGGLENVPETGTMFCEPINPTAFPVHEYEKVRNKSPQYETPVSSRVRTVTSPSALTSSQEGEVRPRTNSGVRYETELPPTHADDLQYSKLVRPNEVLPIVISTAPLYSEMGPPEEYGVEEGAFSRSTTELSKRDAPARGFSGNGDRGFTMPTHVGSSGGDVGSSSVSSATDSLASYIAQLQAIDGDKPATDMDGLLFNEQAAHPAQHDGCKRIGSLDTGTRNSDFQQQKRAWSEERRETLPNGMNGRSGFSGSAIDSRSLPRSSAAPKMHREMRVNGIDLRLGDYARTKTMV